MISRAIETRCWSITEDDAGRLTVVPRLDNCYDLAIGARGLHPRRTSMHDGVNESHPPRETFTGMHTEPGPGWFRKLIGRPPDHGGK